jgi:potassium-transporting ATPase KdpC subunit
VDGRAVGSELIGQQFSDSLHFWGRPSATGPAPYNASSSSASNLAPTNDVLLDSISQRVKRVRASNLAAGRPVPVDLVTASGSGLDPHISVDAALYQVNRVAMTTGIPLSTLNALVSTYAAPRGLGFLGEPRVNVLQLNIAVDALYGRKEMR